MRTNEKIKKSLSGLLGIAAVLLNRKKLLCLLTVCLLLAVMPVRVSADTDVAAMLESLPTVEQFQAMDADARLEAYNRTQAAYDAYMALSEEEKAGMENAEETFETLFGYFNTLVAPAEEPAETASSNNTASNLLSTAIAAVVGILLAQKLITKRKIG